MVDQLRAFAAEVTRVAREVGSQGILGGQARVDGVSGVWKDLTDNVNFMASNLTTQVRNIADVTTAVAHGDLGRKITVQASGEVAALAATLTTQLRAIADVSTAVTQGDLTRSIAVEARGEVEELKDNINQMITNLRETTEVNAQQDWLNTNMARFSGMLQGQRDLEQV